MSVVGMLIVGLSVDFCRSLSLDCRSISVGRCCWIVGRFLLVVVVGLSVDFCWSLLLDCRSISVGCCRWIVGRFLSVIGLSVDFCRSLDCRSISVGPFLSSLDCRYPAGFLGSPP